MALEPVTHVEVPLSPKTIEYHLRNVYRKLDVRSRAELSESMARLN
jgi:DNA-binding CsgD family transcriptional regulator